MTLSELETKAFCTGASVNCITLSDAVWTKRALARLLLLLMHSRMCIPSQKRGVDTMLDKVLLKATCKKK